MPTIITGRECVNSVSELMNAGDMEISDRGTKLPSVSGRVDFENVSYVYPGATIPTIKDFTLHVKQGECIAVVGGSGAGKSTLANLLMRLYDHEEGEIRIGGIPVKDLSLETVYRNIAIVSQETYLFMGTILDNIRYAKPGASYDEVIEAAKCAGAHDFIVRLPNGYHTRVGFGFQELSGGERQRAWIAMTIAQEPEILILDEPLSGVDVEGMSLLMDMLDEIRKKFDLSILMTTHDFTMLEQYCDQVVLLQGKILRRGTPLDVLNSEEFAQAFHMGGGAQA